MTGGQLTIPLTAWEQAAVVVIFAVILLTMAGAWFAFIRWVLNWARAREGEWQKFIKELRVEEHELRCEDQERQEGALDAVRAVLDSLGERMSQMVDALEQHDRQASEIKSVVERIDRRLARPDKKGGVG